LFADSSISSLRIRISIKEPQRIISAAINCLYSGGGVLKAQSAGIQKAKNHKGKYPEYSVVPISTIREMFLQSVRKHENKPALQYKKSGQWIPITYKELNSDVALIACGMAALGLTPVNGKVAIVGDNRPEWAISYLAAACTGIVCIPIDKDLKETEVFNILCVSGAQVVISDSKHMEMLIALRSKLPELMIIACMDAEHVTQNGISFEEIKSRGRERIASGRNDFEAGVISSENLLSILFTSGTMGNSKGVMLTHGNVACNLMDAAKWVNFNGKDRFLSVLPLHHSYECTDGFLLALYAGCTISYAENLRRIPENLAETSSTVMLGVPLLWHSMYAKIESAMAHKGMRKVLVAKKAADFCERYLGLNLRRLIFAQVHKKFGGCLRILISGGAAVDPAVAKGFRELGIEFLQGYGLTESSPIITVNRNKTFKDDSAGLPLPSVDVKIDEDGEILASGPSIMKGYFNNPDATHEALEDGWLHTGDLGYIDKDGFLYIQGRKKSVIVTPAGKKIYPEEVEGELIKSPYILECLVWGRPVSPGENPEIEAIVVPDKDYLLSQGWETGNECIENLLRKEVKERCKNLAAFKLVTKLSISYEALEKTTTQKIKRYLYVRGDISGKKTVP
jgi:long-chain acyl-CoA synthetase